MKKLVILGSGLATRLYPITENIPKVLVNYGQHTILKNLYDTYKGQVDEIILVLNSKFIDITKEYCKLFNLDVNILCVDEAYGSAYAISRIAHHLIGHSVILNWCDIIPKFNDKLNFKNEIFTFGNECRYLFKNNKIENVGKTGGNIVGIYSFENFYIQTFDSKEETHDYFQGRDFVDFIDSEEFKECILKDLIDLGDIPKLLKHTKSMSIAREFNEVVITGNMVYKTALNAKGKELQKNEINWYNSVAIAGVKNIPLIYNYRDSSEGSMISMERIKELPIAETFKPEMIDQILKSLNFSGERIASHFYDDMKYEILDKVLSRCSEIQGIIDSYGKITHVNCTRLGRLETMLKQAFNHLMYKVTPVYNIIHGDPNFSNMFMTETGVKFIDPRGYFGKSELFGPKMYDECKVLYALSGYDKFNSDPIWGNFKVKGSTVYMDIEPLYDNWLSDKRFTDYHRLWVAVIWIALGGYFKNNPLKAVASYYYGMKLLTEILSKLGRRLQNGGIAYEEDLYEAVLTTKCPDKWILTDLETGEKYKPSSEYHSYWKKI